MRRPCDTPFEDRAWTTGFPVQSSLQVIARQWAPSRFDVPVESSTPDDSREDQHSDCKARHQIRREAQAQSANPHSSCGWRHNRCDTAGASLVAPRLVVRLAAGAIPR